ncbi:Rv3235 family protein [Canibacter zhoujuaniae]|uniref:Rv3235 family protein n=1 Tax=Canibacter zhoujuaniae TaxID=2708343 RepID=UPI00141FD8B0|nr:Rv3235 family protein [Canibacter zhoujuaniae]
MNATALLQSTFPEDLFVLRLARFAIEIVHIGRPVQHIARWATPAVLARLQAQQCIQESQNYDYLPRKKPHPVKPHLCAPNEFGRLRRFQHTPEIEDCVALIPTRNRVIAVSVRLRRRENRWWVTDIAVL